MTREQALCRLTTLCAKAEYCRHDIWQKMLRWQIDPEPDQDLSMKQAILNELVRERYIDERRFAHAFVRDKFRYNRWGRVRILQELHKREIADEVANEALDEELAEEDVTDTLRQLIDTKRRSVKGRNDYEINGKLIRFALSRGFDMETIRRVINNTEEDD